jgi:hypothetical protein
MDDEYCCDRGKLLMMVFGERYTKKVDHDGQPLDSK